ncbi:MAG: hypothetical protein ACJ8H8_17520 [Geminicoccaceae bacterium]
MLAYSRIWRRALPRALYVATSLTATPALGCPAISIDELASKLPGADRFDFDAAQLLPFLALWDQRSSKPLPVPPDGVALFARHDQRPLIAFRQAGCLMALLPIPAAALWRALHQYLGPIA